MASKQPRRWSIRISPTRGVLVTGERWDLKSHRWLSKTLTAAQLLTIVRKAEEAGWVN